MPINKGPSTPPPMIGKIGPYTVFMTPPSTPSPKPPPPTTSNESTLPVFDSPKKVVSPPPQQIDKSVYSQQVSDGSVLGFFKNAVNKVQNAHSSLDDHLARWLGLNQSKYQWALDDYYETKGLKKEGAKAEEISSKIQRVNASGCLKGPLCKFLGYALLNSLLAAAAYRELFVH
ncbi:proline-rich receptor-like protein kinase PERK11 [Populus alba x Populus x berolinensis]|nr:proline-rich receptor-like protein kinase PERK11 [Populus alba x Populus x berolinensis]KAJ6957970.1 proline-rich receptor-like protein kinase PERK11 [Populus alba x Populus x berolinensis]